ncbi:extensin-like domain-containing protein [Yoonia sp. 208BN28-4]|uniref:extensin-like domain-containing protein n=1 Tax=Yoonia sp. 208BN28-4 TaxID=3126505 RepID=UPI0030B6B470
MMRAAALAVVLASPAIAQEAADTIVVPQDGAGQRDLLMLDDAAYGACLTALDELGVVYSEAAPIVPEDDADCGILRPLTITEIAPGVAIDPAATVRCPTAEALAVWTRDFVLPAAARLDDRGPLASILNGSGYICRRRNNAADGKLSEHAFGNAFDVMGFTFTDGANIAIEPREAQGTMAESFQDAVRASACLDFSTVLGPGSNAMHDDHLHLDIVARSSGYRLCEQGGATDQ